MSQDLRFVHPSAQVPDVNADSSFGREAGRLGNAQNLLGSAIFDIASALLHAAPSVMHPGVYEDMTCLGNERLPQPYSEAAQEVLYLTSRLAAQIHDHDRREYDQLVEDLHMDGFCAFHGMGRRRNLWDSGEAYQVFEDHRLLLKRGTHPITEFAFTICAPRSGFDPSDPRHTTYLLKSLAEAYGDEIGRFRRKRLPEFVGEIRSCDPRFSDDPLGTFDQLERLTLAFFSDQKRA